MDKKEQYTNTIVQYFPPGKLYKGIGVAGTNLRNFISGFSEELINADNKINEILFEHYIPQTERFIEEWESAVGIPDECFPIVDDIELRRKHILVKLLALGTQTTEDFQDVAKVLGYDITLEPHTPSQFNTLVNFIGTVASYGGWPWSWPHFWGGESSYTECFLKKLKPAHTTMSFKYFPLALEATISVGNSPTHCTIYNKYCYVTSTAGDAVIKIDLESNSIVTTINLPTGAEPIGIDNNGTYIMVCNKSNYTVVKIDLTTYTIVNTIAVSFEPRNVTMNSNYAWVVEGNNNVVKIDLSTDTIVANIGLAGAGTPSRIVLKNGYVWVLSDSYLNKIDATTNVLVSSIVLPSGKNWQGVDTDGINVYAASEIDGKIAKVNIEFEDVEILDYGTEPFFDIKIGRGMFYVTVRTLFDSKLLGMRLSDDQLLYTASTGNTSRGIGISDKYLCVVDSYDNNLRKII